MNRIKKWRVKFNSPLTLRRWNFSKPFIVILINLFNEELRAAAAALPFEHPKLTAVALLRKEDMALALENALRQTTKVRAERMKVIEAPNPAGEPTQVSEPQQVSEDI